MNKFTYSKATYSVPNETLVLFITGVTPRLS